jgi:hypothetical protein
MTRTAAYLCTGVTAVLFATRVQADDVADRMYQLGASLNAVAAAVESTVRYKNPPPDLTDAQLLELATQHEPQMLEPLAKYVLKIKREGGHAVVLVCARKSNVALLEDAGCTARTDRHAWRLNPAPPCEFALRPADACRSGQ